MCLSQISQGKDEVYDRMLLDYFLSYHQFIHLLCRVAINCEKFTDTLVKLSTHHFSVCLCEFETCFICKKSGVKSKYVRHEKSSGGK